MSSYRARRENEDHAADVGQGDVTEAIEQFIDVLEASWQSNDSAGSGDTSAESDADLCTVE